MSHPIHTDNPDPNVYQQMSLTALETMMERVLDKKLSQLKHEILRDLTPEFEKLQTDIFDLRQENEDLRRRVELLEKAHRDERDNIQSAKVRAIENDQYAQRTNMLVFGLEELRKDELIPLKHDDIEICHRLGKKTLNKTRPVVVKFRFSDVKWDVMAERKNLKGSGITLSEDLCFELQQLEKEVSNHPGVQSCRAWNGKVLAKDKAGKVKPVKYGSDCKNKFPVNHPPVANNESMTDNTQPKVGWWYKVKPKKLAWPSYT